MADLHYDENREVSCTEIASLNEMYMHSLVFGALKLRFEHLLLDQSTVMDGDRKLGADLQRVYETHWVPFVSRLAKFYFLYGFCLYILVDKWVDCSDEDGLRKEKLGELHNLAKKKVLTPVPAPPVEGTFIIRMRLRKKQKELYCVSIDGNEAKHIKVIQSTLCDLPSWVTGQFQSEGAALLDCWRALKETQRFHRQVEASLAAPTYGVQRQKRGDMETLTELQTAHADDLSQLSVNEHGFIMRKNIEVKMIEPFTFDHKYQRLFVEGKLIDRGECAMRVPDGFEIASALPEPKVVLNYLEAESRFAEKVGFVTTVPFPYCPGQDKAMIENKGGGQSNDTERNRLIKHMISIRNDMILGLKQIWFDAYPDDIGRDIQFHIPLQTNVEKDTLERNLERGVISDDVYAEESLNMMNVEHRRVKTHRQRHPKLRRFELDVEQQQKMKQHKK
jgi:hypothetical protein